MGRLKVYFLFGWSTGCVRVSRVQDGCVDNRCGQTKNSKNLWRNLLKRVIRIRRTNGGVEAIKLSCSD